MKAKNILYASFIAVVVAFGMSSCISDDSTYAEETSIPTLSIKGMELSTMPVTNVYLGNACVITPEITYSGNEADLTYSWKIGSYANSIKGELEEVSTERNLNYNFTDGGSYYAHLTVTDGKVGKAMDYRINVNRTFEEGYLLTSTDADGGGNLAFVKILTPEEIAAGQEPIVIEHCLEKMNEGYSENGLIKAVKGTVTWPSSLTRILVSTQTNCYVVDPNNFTIITDMKYSDLYSDFKADFFNPDSYTPYAYDKTTKKYAHINLTYMFPYEYQYFLGGDAEDFQISKYVSWGSETTMTHYMNYTKSQVAMFSAYAPYFGLSTYFPNTGNLLDGEQLLTAFSGYDPVNYITPTYILSKNKTTGVLSFWTDAKDSYYYTVSNFTRQTFTPTSETAIPAQGTHFVASRKQQRFFYPIDNRLYVFLASTDFVLPNKSQYAIEFGASEEITFVETNFSTDELYVATFDSNTQRGNFYIYDCKDVRSDNSGSVKPTATYKSCAGRISYLMYKPSIQ